MLGCMFVPLLVSAAQSYCLAPFLWILCVKIDNLFDSIHVCIAGRRTALSLFYCFIFIFKLNEELVIYLVLQIPVLFEIKKACWNSFCYLILCMNKINRYVCWLPFTSYTPKLLLLSFTLRKLNL